MQSFLCSSWVCDTVCSNAGSATPPSLLTPPDPVPYTLKCPVCLLQGQLGLPALASSCTLPFTLPTPLTNIPVPYYIVFSCSFSLAYTTHLWTWLQNVFCFQADLSKICFKQRHLLGAICLSSTSRHSPVPFPYPTCFSFPTFPHLITA